MKDKLTDAEDRHAASRDSKKPYEKPRVTTLGRVADLTNGAGGSIKSDAMSTRSTGHHSSSTSLTRHTS